MAGWLALVLVASSGLASDAARLTLCNPTELARIDILSLHVGDLGFTLPAEGSLEVRIREGLGVRSQVEDLDQSGNLSAGDEVVFEVRTAPYERVEIEIGVGKGLVRRATSAPAGDLWIRARDYRARVMAEGGWLGELRSGNGPNLIGGGLHLVLGSDGFQPPAAFDQRNVSAQIIHCKGPLREVVLARYDLDENPPRTSEDSRPGEGLCPGYRGEVLYAAHPDHLEVTHRVIPKEPCLAISTCCAVAHLPLAAGAGRVFERWAVAGSEGEAPSAAALRGGEWSGRLALARSPWLGLSGPAGALTLVADQRTTSLVELGATAMTDPLSYARFMDSTESAMWLVPHRRGEDVSGLVARLSAPLEIESAPGREDALVAEARRAVARADAALRETRRGEALVTPAEIQLEAAQHLLAMAELCAGNHRDAQAVRLAGEATSRAGVAHAFLTRPGGAGLRAPAPARNGDILLGVRFGGAGKAFPSAWERSLRRLKSYGLTCVHDVDALSWARCEPEAGVFDLSSADAYVDMLARIGMRCLACIDPWRSTPAWAEGADDPWPLVKRYFEHIIPRCRSRDLILAWAVRDQPTVDALGGLESPEGPAFARWLEDRYETIGKLNAAWGSDFASFGDLTLPEVARGPELTPPVAFLGGERSAPRASEGAAAARDLNLFASHRLVRDLRRPARLAGELDRERPVVINSADAQMTHNPARVGDPWALREVQPDAYCHVFRSGASDEASGGGDRRLDWAFATALESSAVGGAPIWCAEFLQDPREGRRRCASRVDTRIATWAAIGEGLRGAFAFSHPGGACPAGSFDDCPLPALEEYGVLSAELRAPAPLISEAKPWPAEIAVYYPRDSILQKFGGAPELALDPITGPRMALRSLWQALSVGEHYPVEFLVDEDVLGKDLEGYRALILVEAEFLSEEIARRAAEFARGGGMLIVMGPCGVFDAHANQHPEPPAAPLREVMGARLASVREASVTVNGRAITARGPVACYTVDADDVRTLGALPEGDAVTVFSRDVGEGRVIVIGGNIGVATDTPEGAGRRWLADQLCRRGLFPPVMSSLWGEGEPRLCARVFTQEDRAYLLAVNLAEREQKAALTVADGIALSDRPYDLLTGAECARRGRRSILVELPIGGVMWVCL